jgi:hypothetical protein
MAPAVVLGLFVVTRQVPNAWFSTENVYCTPLTSVLKSPAGKSFTTKREPAGAAKVSQAKTASDGHRTSNSRPDATERTPLKRCANSARRRIAAFVLVAPDESATCEI